MGPCRCARVARLPKGWTTIECAVHRRLLTFISRPRAGPNFNRVKGEAWWPANRKGDSFMRSLTRAIANFLEREDGPTAVEYAVMLALIVVVCITAITSLGSNANKTFSNVALNTAVGSGS